MRDRENQDFVYMVQLLFLCSSISYSNPLITSNVIILCQAEDLSFSEEVKYIIKKDKKMIGG